MATFRVGVGSFNIQDGAVGFGTDTDGLGNLKVKGVTKTTDIKVSGASTLTRYSGFAADNINQLENITLTSEVGTIGDIVVGVGTSVIISSASTVTVGTVESVSIGTHFSPPKGGIEERGEDFVEGMMRFNTDLNTMEFYNGNEWRQFTYISDVQNSPSSRGRGVFFAGSNPSPSTVDLFSMEYITIASLGNSIDFGVLENNPRDPAAFSSSVRGFVAGGDPPPNGTVTDKIEYFTIASEGNAIDFGNLTDDRRSCCGNSSSTRGIVAGGYDDQASANVNVIDYVEMSTVGNALDFGDLTRTERANSGGSNGVRAIFAGGWGSPGTSTVGKDINMLTISSKGNALKFGELTRTKSTHAGGSNSVRCIFAGGYMFFDTSLKEIDYVTIASEGNATNFGELNTRRMSVTDGSAVNSTRFVLGGGSDYFPAGNNNGSLNSMEFITIASTGGGQDFGDLTSGSTIVNRRACSDAHGGLGGY